MMRNVAILLVALCFAMPPKTVAGQADWTFQVPLQITALPPEVDEGIVLCAVGPEAFSNFQEEVREFWNAEELWSVAPGDPIPDWPGAPSTSGYRFGFQTFVPDASGSAPPSVQVEINAPDDTPHGVMTGAVHWACTIGLHLTGGQVGFQSPDPDFILDSTMREAFLDTGATPMEGARSMLVVTGTVPGS